MDAPPSSSQCPGCSKPMQLARITPRFGGLPELRTFECRHCGIASTEAVDDVSPRPSAKHR